MMWVAIRMSGAALLLIAASMSGCASRSVPSPAATTQAADGPAESSADTRDAVNEWNTFMARNPILVGHEQCALKIALYGDVHTWTELAARSTERCVPSERWHYFGQTQDGGSYYYDQESIALRKGDQVDLWILSNSPSLDDSQHNVTVTSRIVVDCDKRLFFFVDTVLGGADGSVRAEHLSSAWQSAPPGSMVGEFMNAACRYRSAALSGPPSNARVVNPAPPSETRVRAPTQKEIDRALKTYLRERYAF